MDNLRGILLMVAAMLGFAFEDLFIKASAKAVSVGQILVILGVAGTVVFALLTLRQGKRLLSRDLLRPAVMLRNTMELLGTMFYISAVALTPLASASSILQAMPLIVTLGAALFLGEPVGWRRWSAIVVGFLGVLLVIRPGMDGFEVTSLLAVAGAFTLAARDLATRVIPKTISSMQLSAYGFASIIPLGIVMMMLGDGWQPMTERLWLLMAGASFAGVIGYYALVAAMRVGEIAVVTPYRYSRLVFALIIGAVVFDETPDNWTLAGAALIITAGLYSLFRETRARRVKA